MMWSTREDLYDTSQFKPPSFDDVLMVPSYTSVSSRLEPKTSTILSNNFELNIPVISSPMDTVTEEKMALSLGENGGLGIVHRFMSPQCQLGMLRAVYDGGIRPAFAVGVGAAERDRFNTIYSELGDKISWVSIDVANGHSEYMGEMLSWVKERVSEETSVMAGNVATGLGYLYLSDRGADAVRVGIGGGSICKTRIMTGYGVPTLYSVLDCHRVSMNHKANASIIADGGIRYPADLVKSIAAGADAVMAGRIFAGTLESPGETVIIGGASYKTYRGMASKEVQDDRRGGLRPGTCAEGVSTHIPLKGKARYILSEFSGGLRSAMTYAGARSITEFREMARFIRVSQASLDESHAFGTKL